MEKPISREMVLSKPCCHRTKISTKSNKACGVEALLRWEHPTLGFISPVKFIPIAEESGLIVDMGLWVINEAFKQLSVWKKKGYIAHKNGS